VGVILAPPLVPAPRTAPLPRCQVGRVIWSIPTVETWPIVIAQRTCHVSLLTRLVDCTALLYRLRQQRLRPRRGKMQSSTSAKGCARSYARCALLPSPCTPCLYPQRAAAGAYVGCGCVRAHYERSSHVEPGEAAPAADGVLGARTAAAELCDARAAVGCTDGAQHQCWWREWASLVGGAHAGAIVRCDNQRGASTGAASYSSVIPTQDF
jgi:hypothetical protein